MSAEDAAALTYAARIEALRKTKLEQTEEKKALIGCMDHDDWAVVLPVWALQENRSGTLY